MISSYAHMPPQQTLSEETSRREIFQDLEKLILSTPPETIRVTPSPGDKEPYSLGKTVGDVYTIQKETFTITLDSRIPPFGHGSGYYLEVKEGTRLLLQYWEDMRDREELRAYSVKHLYTRTKEGIQQWNQEQEASQKQKDEHAKQQQKQDSIQRFAKVLRT